MGLSVIVTLGGLSYPTRSWSCVRLHMHVSDAYMCEISGRNSFKGEGGKSVKPQKIQNFRKG